jgi:hypothetical protein
VLADLHRIRDLQVLQRRALVDADGERLEALDAERMRIQDRLVPLASSGLTRIEQDAARALAREILTEQESLLRVAAEVRDRIGAELRSMSTGRSALHGYRPTPAGGSLYLDRAS